MPGRSHPAVGYECVHSMVDDHSRFAYSEIHDNRRSETCAGFILRAAQTFATLGYRIDRVMTDNAWGYRRGKAFADALAQSGAAHKLTRPNRPQTNGKPNPDVVSSVERGRHSLHGPVGGRRCQGLPGS